ncbi:MAG: OPT/YSL family transporter [Phycisphaerales bacterium]|nr:MAG: OPT/YSL family transporter [Phycisphaerales bacterium]
MAEPQGPTKFPDNAYRELKPGEKYVPMVPPDMRVPELTFRAMAFGLVMNIIFSVAATFLALKAGQGIETAIPISILAVGLSGFLLKAGGRASSILENVYVLALSTTSGYVAGGTCFTMPAIYILKLNTDLEMSNLSLFLQISLVPFLGAILGILFLIPFRRYFVKEMHGKLPFPEATATNEILVTGASGSTSQAWILIYSFILSAVYTFLATGLKLFSDVFTTGKAELTALGKATVYRVETLAFGTEGLFADLTEKVKAVISMGAGAYYLGLGFIIGLRYASIICAGSFLSVLVITPLLGRLDLDQLHRINSAVASADAGDIWYQIPRVIGIGAIFTAGLLSIIKMSKVIVTALTQALGGLFKSDAGPVTHDRTDQDISYPAMMLLGLATVVVMAIFFRLVVFAEMANPNWMTFISVVLALVIAFLFTTVSAWAIAMISVTPISGMTVTTIIICAVLMSLAGLPKGPQGMLAVLLVGGVVCTALSLAGGLVTNFKMGYWLGASPKRIAWLAITGALISAIFVCGTIMILDFNPGYTPDKTDPLPAPQANMMAGALQSFLGTGEVPWLLYGIGVVVALTVELVGISALAFGLGMYLPMEINLPILIGAFVAMLVKKSTKDANLAKARSNKGILIASGLIAGGAIMEVAVSFTGAVDQMAGWKAARPIQEITDATAHAEATDAAVHAAEAGESVVGKIMPALDFSGGFIDGGTDPIWLARFENFLGLIMFLALCLFVFWDCLRAKPDADAPEIHM